MLLPDPAGNDRGYADLTRRAVEQARASGQPRVLFSAHGLPKKVVEAGDPYQWQVERTAAAVADKLAIPDLDWRVTYQSKVGPLEWLGPATDAEIERAGKDGGCRVVVVPIAFVSEHSETLVELDIEYRELAEHGGVPAYHRVPAPGTHQAFIGGLADLVRHGFGTEAACAARARGGFVPAIWGQMSARLTFSVTPTQAGVHRADEKWYDRSTDTGNRSFFRPSETVSR